MEDGNTGSLGPRRAPVHRAITMAVLIPAGMVFVRLVLAFIWQGLTAILFFSEAPSPMEAAAPWWPVYGTLIDARALLLILFLIRRERVSLSELLKFDAERFTSDVLRGLLAILWVFPVAMAGIIGSSLLFFGTYEPPSVYYPLPIWASLYSLLIFPLLWAVVEQGTYQGYALVRLETLLPNRVSAVALVVSGWALQHLALPFIPNLDYLLFRTCSFIPLAILMTLVFLRTRRLIPLIIAHWAVDMLGVFTGMILPLLLKQ